jgi:methionyl-tRNA formyltransferase
MRVIFMGTPEFAIPTLSRLVGGGHEVAAVFTQPDKPAGRGNKLQEPPVKIFAASRGIPCYQPARIKTNEEVKDLFQSVSPDVCIVAAYGKILPAWLLEIPRLGCINVHASLLPKYRGAAPINWAIANGEPSTGITIMQMDAGMDTGAIWSQRSTLIGPDEIAPELSVRLAAIGAELLPETLPIVESQQSKPIPQDEAAATYAPMLKKEHGLIDWKLPAASISSHIRAFQPWPGSYTVFRGARLIVWRAREVQSARPAEAGQSSSAEQSAEPGYPQATAPASITSVDRSGFTVQCGGSTALSIQEIQIEGKKRLPGRDFINGARLLIGDTLLQ